MVNDPRLQVRAWLPHVLMLGALVAAVALLLQVASPLFEPILLAAALAILTSPVLCEPFNRVLLKRFPAWKRPLRNKIAGVAATVTIVLIAIAPVLIVIISQAENLSDLSGTIQGVLTRNAETIDKIAVAIADQVAEIGRHYKRLDLPSHDEVRAHVKDFLSESSDVNSAFLDFIRAGTGTVAHVILALVSLAYFFIDGPRLVRGLLGYSPLTEAQQANLKSQHRRVVLRLLNDTVVTAFVKGIVLGGLVYIVDRALGGGSLPFLPIAIVAAVITLLPVVGVTMVWLPFAGLAWSQGNQTGAIVLALACWTSNFLLDRYRNRISSRLQQSEEWLGFLLFVGIVGGLLTYGPKGLIIGPFAVVMVITIGRGWLPLYVHDRKPDPEDTDGRGPTADPAPFETASEAPSEPDGDPSGAS